MVNVLLQQFLDSNLEELPDSCLVSTYNNPDNLRCCFCGNKTDIGGVILVNQDSNFLKPATDYVACTTCLDPIMEAEEQVFGMHPRSAYVTSELISEGTSPLDLFIEFLRFKGSASGFTLEQLDKNEDLVCYFTGKIVTEKDLHYITLPVGGQVSTITGGVIVHSEEVLNDPVFSTRLEHYEQSLCNDTCVKCGRLYYLDASEYSYRISTRELGEYLCPRCTVNNLREGGKSPHVNRFETLVCKVCKTTAIPVDVMKAVNNQVCLDCMMHRKLIHSDVIADYEIKIYENYHKGEYSVYVYDRTTGLVVMDKVFTNLPTFNDLLNIYMTLKV